MTDNTEAMRARALKNVVAATRCTYRDYQMYELLEPQDCIRIHEHDLIEALTAAHAARHAAGVRESAQHLEKLAADLLEREEQREAAPNYETRSQARYFRFAAAVIRGQP